MSAAVHAAALSRRDRVDACPLESRRCHGDRHGGGSWPRRVAVIALTRRWSAMVAATRGKVASESRRSSGDSAVRSNRCRGSVEWRSHRRDRAGRGNVRGERHGDVAAIVTLTGVAMIATIVVATRIDGRGDPRAIARRLRIDSEGAVVSMSRRAAEQRGDAAGSAARRRPSMRGFMAPSRIGLRCCR